MKPFTLAAVLASVAVTCASAHVELPNAVPEAIHEVFTGAVERRSSDKKEDRRKYHPNEASNYRQVQRFWDNFMYPKNRAVVSSKDKDGILADDVRGRVDITRSFEGKELNMEYLFGTFSAFVPANQFQFVSLPVNYTIVQFASTDNTASQSVVVDFLDQLTGTIAKLQIDAWTQYNKKGQIQQYDAIFRRYPNYFQTTLDSKAAGLYALYKRLTNVTLSASRQSTETAAQGLLAYSICQTHTTNCVGKLKEYSSQAECFDHLTRLTPLGQPWSMGQNNVLCRAIHQQMVSIRPDEHCPHLGKSGGGMCIDTPYSDNFLPFYKNSWNPYL